MVHSEEPGPEPANLRFLRRLVTLLTAVMLAGLILIIALIVIRFRDSAPPLPDDIALPDGSKAEAVTLTGRYVLVVSKSSEIFVFDRITARMIQRLRIEPDAD